MNSCLTLGLLAIVLAVTQAKVDPEQSRKNFQNCKAETGAEESYEYVYKDQKLPTTPKGKCLMRCLLIARRITDSFDVYDPEGTAAYFKEFYQQAPEKIAPALRVTAKCSNMVPVSADKCDVAVKRIICAKVEGDKENLGIKVE